MTTAATAPSPTGPAGRHIALLIDADNISHTKIAGILSELSKDGTPNIRRAYGDWTNKQLSGWTAKLHEFAIRPIQQFSYSSGKNATDISMVIDAMELLYTQRLDGFAIASSDADFTPLVMHLKAAGHAVYGFGERKTPDPFVNACTTFLYLDTLGAGPSDEPGQTAKPTAAKASAKAPAKPTSKTAEKPTRNLAGDAKLVTILRGAVEATARDDGWALMSIVGSTAKRQAPIDPRNYDMKTFTELFSATGLFDVTKGADGKVYVADKRSKDRAKQPGV